MTAAPGSTRMTKPTHSIAAFYVNGAVREVIPIYPLYAIMFGEHGVSAIELSVLFSVWAAVGIIMEVPSGALADRYSRKWLIVASGLLKSLAFVTWYLTQHFYGYMAGFILWGLGSTLRSGAWEALLHDLLKSLKQAEMFTHHYGRIKAMATVGVVLGELAGGLLVVYGFDQVLLVSAAVPILATIPFAVLVNDMRSNATQARPSYLVLLKQGTREAIANRRILYILLATTFLLTAFAAYDEFIPPVLFQHGFTFSEVAYLAAPIYLAQALGHGLAGRLVHLTITQLFGIMLAATLSLLLTTLVTGIWVPIMMSGFFFAFGLAGTLFAGFLQREIEGAARATVTSTVGLGDGAGAILWFLAFGALAEQSSMIIASGVYALLVLCACAVFYYLGRRWRITIDQ